MLALDAYTNELVIDTNSLKKRYFQEGDDQEVKILKEKSRDKNPRLRLKHSPAK